MAIVGGAAAIAAAATGNGSIVASPPVTIIRVAAGVGSGTAVLDNTTGASITVEIAPDASCDPAVGFSVVGGTPFALGPGAMKQVQLSCAANQPAGMQRCLLHATDTSTAPLADLLGVCEYASLPSLQPAATLVDLGTVMIGDSSSTTLSLTNTSAATTITKLFLQTTDLDHNFEFSTPCNPDAAFCNGNIAAVGSGSAALIVIKCTPQTTGLHTAQLSVATDTAQYLTQPVTLQCTGGAATAPVLAINPATVDVTAPVEVIGASASAAVHVSNIGTGVLTINDIRIVDVDTGAAIDWAATASGKCSGAIPPACALTAGEQVDINLTFDPSTIGIRRASLLVSYHDTIDRTRSIPLSAIGQGARLALVGTRTTLDLGMVPINRTSQIDFTLVNQGNRDTTAMLSLMPAGAPFTLNPAASATVTATAFKAVTVICAPTAPGVFSTVVTVQSSDVFMSPPITLTISCEGTTAALFANPTTLSLGEIRIEVGAIQHSVQLLSTAAPQTLSAPPALDMPNPNVMVGSASSSITPTMFDVTVDPMAQGDLAGHIVVTDDASESLGIPLSGHFVTTGYLVATTLDVGTFCVNQPTTSSNTTLTSSGTATIRLQQPVLGRVPSPFELSFTAPTIYPTALSSGQSATIAVTPQRQTAAATINDILTWTTDVDGKLTAGTDISAKFIDSGGAIAPPALDFGKVAVHIFGDDGQRVTIQNCNGTALMLDPPTIKSPFSIDSPNFPAMLNPNETATFSVGFHPTKPGMFSRTLTISSPQLVGAPLEVALFGEGALGPAGETDAGSGGSGSQATSFYACSCSGAGASSRGWPIGCAIVLAVRRRRRRSSVRS